MNTENNKKLEKWKASVKEFQEFELFSRIEAVGKLLYREAHDYSHGRIRMSEETFNENQKYYNAIQKECLEMLPKFKVNIDQNSLTDKEKGDYWKWYSFWKNWMEAFSDDEWKIFEKKVKNQEPIEDFLPKTSWNA